MTLRFVDAFAGVGGFHAGIKRALGDSAKCVSFIEIDKDAREVYSANHCDGSEAEFHDILEVDAEDVPSHDLLCGGFPCQAFSINKQNSKRCETDSLDSRTYMYLELARIARHHRPKFILFENVANLASIKNDSGGLMIDDIKSAFSSIGYSVDCKVLDAADFGVPQQRKRIYIVGRLDGRKISWPEPHGSTVPVRKIIDKSASLDKSLVADFSGKTCTSRCFHVDHPTKSDWMNSERLYCNSATSPDVVHRWAKVPGKNKYERVVTEYSPGEIVRQSKAQAFAESESINKCSKNGRHVICPKSIIMYDTPSGLSRQSERIYSACGLSRTLATFGHPMFNIDGVVRLLSARESARLQGFSDDFVLASSHGKACKQFGNAVCVNVVQAIVEENDF